MKTLEENEKNGWSSGRFDRVPEQALAWVEAGLGVAIATVMETWGSAPRRAGAQLVVNDRTEFLGSISGGCVEGAVVEEAASVIANGTCRILEFGVSDTNAFAVGLSCGGTIRILLEAVGTGPAIDREFLRQLVVARASRAPVAVCVDTENWQRRLIPQEKAEGALLDRFDQDASGVENGNFYAIHNPDMRLVIVGAVHIAQTLMPMARLAGFHPVLVDPRTAFATGARFPNETIIQDWPDTALQELGLDARTAVVTLTHDEKLDDPAIQIALRSPAFYVGSLGSAKTHQKRMKRLSRAGFDAHEIEKVRAPVGLDIGAQTPAEIAVSVLAQIIDTVRGGD